MEKLRAEDRVFTIAEFTALLNEFFKSQEARIKGEISELKRAASGHVYFTVKDKEENAVMDAIIWSRNYMLCGVALEVGMEVILSGHPNLYAPSGRLSFVADTVELVGEGALKKAYDALFKKLSAEGAFAEERKRPLPEFPEKIGVITSMKGAVIHDFENNLGKFGFKVLACDSRVEGQQATAPLMDALARMRREAEEGNIDVLVVIRGGGSLESLQAFNNEALVRAIMDFPVPVIAGIGHDKDVPLAALAADFMTSTPTAAAHLMSEPWEEAYAEVREAGRLFERVDARIAAVRTELTTLWDAIIDRAAEGIRRVQETFANAEQLLRVHDPRRPLRLGYAIVRKAGAGGAAGAGTLVRSTKDVTPGDALNTEVADGVIRSRVENP